MKITIHRGAQQIGGCITEIQSEKARIIIDMGAELPAVDIGEKTKPIQVEGVTKGNINCDGVFISHYHGDHVGEYKRVKHGIPIYMGEIAQRIYLTLQNRLSKSQIKKVTNEDVERVKEFIPLRHGEKVEIKGRDMIVTPLQVDHSAFDSYMFLIEADNQRILHTGDFRSHGQYGDAIFEMLENVFMPDGKKLDALIIEGTMLSRIGEDVDTEEQLARKAEAFFRDEKNKYIFLMCSSTNISRISAFYQASKDAGKNKLFICDDFQRQILDVLNEESKDYDFSNIQAFVSNSGMYENMRSNGFYMLVRNNPFSKKFLRAFKNNLFIYSLWKGYLEGKTQNENMAKFVPEKREYLHTSGHATAETIKEVIRITKPGAIIPIHGEDSHNYDKLGIPKNIVKHMRDGQTFDIETENIPN